MTDQFSISIKEWLAPAFGDPAEMATNAEIEIVVGENCVTQVEDFDSKTVRSTIKVPAEPLAKWLLANWWRLRWEADPVVAHEELDWAMSHCLAGIGGGHVWPDLIFRGSDGSKISVICKKHLTNNAAGISPIRFLNSFSTFVSAGEFEVGVRSFVETVIARLNSLNIRNTELHDLWRDFTSEWSNSKLSSHRKMEALLGLEPDQDEGLVSQVVRWSTRFGRSAVEEVSAVSNGSDILRVLSEARKLSKSVKTYADLSEVSCPDLVQSCGNLGGVTPWQRARSLAYALRDKWGFARSPVSDSQLAERMSLSEAKLQETTPQSPLSFGYRGPANGKLGFVLNREYSHGRRFDVARLIGDFIYFEIDERLIPATSSMTARQKFQRAFAAEFLCPSVTLKERYSRGIDARTVEKVVDEISAEYNVGEHVVFHHLENRDVLFQELMEAPPMLS